MRAAARRTGRTRSAQRRPSAGPATRRRSPRPCCGSCPTNRPTSRVRFSTSPGGVEAVMRIAVLGGGGAMGGLFGGYLARAGEDVVLVDVSQASIDAIERDGLAIEEKDGSTATIRVKASSKPKDVSPVDLIVNF